MAINTAAPPKSKKAMAKELGVSRQSLYYKPRMNVKDLAFKVEIEKVMVDNKAYGHKRIAWALDVNKKKVLRVMKLFGLKPLRRRKKPSKPDDVNQAPADIPNLIKGTIVNALNQVWVKDFTYLPYFGKFVYLATVEDFFTREVIGWAVSMKHDTALVMQAMLNALENHPAPKITHSDQGSEYASKKYLNFLKSLDIKPSMSKKGSPWQNGRQESFYSNFKLELGHPECYPTLGELIEAIATQINYYNKRRIHSAFRCAPAVFAQKCALQQSTVDAKIENVSVQNELHLTIFTQQKNQQLSWNNQEITKVRCV